MLAAAPDVFVSQDAQKAFLRTETNATLSTEIGRLQQQVIVLEGARDYAVGYAHECSAANEHNVAANERLRASEAECVDKLTASEDERVVLIGQLKELWKLTEKLKSDNSALADLIERVSEDIDWEERQENQNLKTENEKLRLELRETYLSKLD